MDIINELLIQTQKYDIYKYKTLMVRTKNRSDFKILMDILNNNVFYVALDMIYDSFGTNTCIVIYINKHNKIDYLYDNYALYTNTPEDKMPKLINYNQLDLEIIKKGMK